MAHGDPLSRAMLLYCCAPAAASRPPGTAAVSSASAAARPGESGVPGLASLPGSAPAVPRRRGELKATFAVGESSCGVAQPGPSWAGADLSSRVLLAAWRR